MQLKAPYFLKLFTTNKFRQKISKIVHYFYRYLPVIIFPTFNKNIGSSDIGYIIKYKTYAHDGFITSHHVGFLEDKHFKISYQEAFIDVPSGILISVLNNIQWRAHICCWAASRCKYLEGDFVELGVWYGILSKAVCRYISFEKTDKIFYLVDSFGSANSHLNYQEDIFKVVKNRFIDYPNVQLIRGLVPEILPSIPAKKVAFLSIDMNSSEPELAALEYYYDKMVPNGIIYFDDYGWGFPDLRRVIDNFLVDKPEKLLHFPSGNSILIKI